MEKSFCANDKWLPPPPPHLTGHLEHQYSGRLDLIYGGNQISLLYHIYKYTTIVNTSQICVYLFY